MITHLFYVRTYPIPDRRSVCHQLHIPWGWLIPIASLQRSDPERQRSRKADKGAQFDHKLHTDHGRNRKQETGEHFGGH